MNYYLNKFPVRDQLILDKISKDVGIIVVIPCYNEPNLIITLQSLKDTSSANCSVEVIVVINASEKDSPAIINQNRKTLEEAKSWTLKNQQDDLKFYFIEENKLSQKESGVGLARKIGMDEAVRRFEAINKKEGVILCFDADASCERNYLMAVEQHFLKYPETPACSIHFEHPVSGNEFSPAIYQGILQYELHLRYYKNALAYVGLPYAYHTVGSSMAVRSDAYQKQGGMNKRKAGEDFYFLQKLIPLGNFTEINTTKVIPSPRQSDRVPFGTGKAMQSWLDNKQEELETYHPQSFIDLKEFSRVIPNLYIGSIKSLPSTVKEFLKTIDFENNLQKIRKNSTSEQHFIKLFYNWFTAFKVLKYVHFARDNFYENTPIFSAANQLLELLNGEVELNNKELLAKYRRLDLKELIQ